MATPAVARSPFVRTDALRRLLSARNVVVLGVVAVVFYIAVVPLGFLLWQTFVRDGHFTLERFREAYSSIGLTEMAMNSIVFRRRLGGARDLARDAARLPDRPY